MGSNLPLISVVVPTFDRWQALKLTLAALCDQDYAKSSYEVIVVDDCSNDSTETEVIRFAANAPMPIRYLRTPSRLGPGGSRNLGISQARGTIIAFTDGDTIPRFDWITRGTRPFLESSLVAGVEGAVIPTEEMTNSPFSHTTCNRSGGRYQCCSMFYRASVIRQAGGFDQRLFDAASGVHFREDLDLALTVIKNGGVIHFEPEAVAFHPTHRPYWRRPIDLAKRYIHDPLLMKKHCGAWRSHIDPLRLGFVRTSMPRHKLYALYLAFAVLILAGWWMQDPRVWTAGIVGEALAAACILLLHWRNCGRAPVASLLLSVPIILSCPYVFALAFGRGWLRARRLSDKL